MILFGGFFAAGIAWRRRRELHTRLMLLATVALLFAPAGRFGVPYGIPVAILVWFLPVFLAMIHDGVTRRRLDRTYLIGLAILLAAYVEFTDASHGLPISHAARVNELLREHLESVEQSPTAPAA